MKLNTIAPAPGSKKAPHRLGRGMGSGLGKTSGKGHKGQKARAGGYHKVGFEGGQMPIQRRLPKFGFKSRVGLFTEELRSYELNKLEAGVVVTLDVLKEANLIKSNTKFVKIISSGDITTALTLSSDSIRISSGAKEQLEKCGGSVQE